MILPSSVLKPPVPRRRVDRGAISGDPGPLGSQPITPLDGAARSYASEYRTNGLCETEKIQRPKQVPTTHWELGIEACRRVRHLSPPGTDFRCWREVALGFVARVREVVKR